MKLITREYAVPETRFCDVTVFVFSMLNMSNANCSMRGRRTSSHSRRAIEQAVAVVVFVVPFASQDGDVALVQRDDTAVRRVHRPREAIAADVGVVATEVMFHGIR